jgi:hypothetical protein
MADRGFVDETIAALTFPRHPYPNVYLHEGRVQPTFTGNLGAITEFGRSMERDKGLGVTVKPVFVEAGLDIGWKGESTTLFNLEKPLAQALVLRSWLSKTGRLASDVKSAKKMDYVIARGRGGISYPSDDTQWKASIAAWVPPDIANEVLTYQEKRLGVKRSDDSHLEYYPSFALTPTRIAIALLGGRELIHTSAVNWIDIEVTCCIFGRKLTDWPDWTLIEPWHVWYELPDD